MTLATFPGVTFHTLDQTVVSVGPYKLKTDLPLGISASARSLDSGSPPQSILSSGFPSQPASKSILHIVGVACITLALLASIRSINSRGSIGVSRESTTTCLQPSREEKAPM